MQLSNFVGGGLTDAPFTIPTVNTILYGFAIILKVQSLLFYILTLVSLSPALLRSPDLPERRAGCIYVIGIIVIVNQNFVVQCKH